MKLSTDTLTILKNFASINSGLEFKAGNVLSTISSGKTVLAKTTIKETFPDTFCIFDLNNFLSCYSLYTDPEITFDEHSVYFGQDNDKLQYRKAAKEMIICPPDKDLVIPSVDVEFKLSEKVLATVLKTANILQSPNIAVESKENKVYLTCFNSKDDSANKRSICVDENAVGNFKMVFLTDNWKMIPGAYDVKISSKGLAEFKHTTQQVDYWIAIESKESKFEV